MKAWIYFLSLTAVVVFVAEFSEMRSEIYSGAGAGFVLGLVGLIFGVRTIQRARNAPDPERDSSDIWGPWAGGLLVRLFLLLPLSWLLWKLVGPQLPVALLTLVAVYSPILFAESHWLAERLTKQAGAAHG